MQDSPISDNEQIFADFAKTYEFFIPKAYRDFLSPEDRRRFMERRLHFLDSRKKEVHVRVENPPPEFFWLAESSIIEVNLPDSKFIVDTIVEHLQSLGYSIKLIIHPVLQVERDEGHKVKAIGRGPHESLVYIEILRLEARELKSLKKSLQENLQELRYITRDFPTTLESLGSLGWQGLEQDFIRWLRDNFIFLGSLELSPASSYKNPRGIFRKKSTKDLLLQNRATGKATRLQPRIELMETNVYSTVNRSRPYYLFSFQTKTGGELLCAGHFSHRAENSMRNQIPVLMEKFEKLAKKLRVLPASFTFKEILQVAKVLPVGLHFTRPDLLKNCYQFVLDNLYTKEPEHRIEKDTAYQMLWLMALVPQREDFDAIMGRLLSCLSEKGAFLPYRIESEIHKNRLLLLGIRCTDTSAQKLEKTLASDLSQIFQTWSVQFRRLINNKYIGQKNINEKLHKFFSGISLDFELRQSPAETLHDVEELEKLEADPNRQIRVDCLERSSAPSIEERASFVIKIYSDAPLLLSDCVPILSNFALRIQNEYSLRFQSPKGPLYIQSFLFENSKIQNKEDRKRLSCALEAVLRSKAASGRLDALVLSACLSAQELKLLNALVAWYFQVERSYARSTIFTNLLRYPDFCRDLMDLFHVRLNPEGTKQESAAIQKEKKLKEKIEGHCNAMKTAQEEKMARQLYALVEAVVRTDFYLENSEISFKIKSRDLSYLMAPVPWFEIFVYDVDMEGTHLRGGPVARGGLRWSDRKDDFRTEILGLMKAQMVKNTVIVPVGSKGGFVIKKNNFKDRAEFLETGKAIYKRYIACLLRLTDNYDARWKVQAAPAIRRRDGDDPYLVVAADKGTARFSDIANSVSEAHGFWLGDAFASGGSHGYDHKKQGITARGAWESVRRHFLEMGQNPDTDPITVVGIGDMGGDVFGNGMLISKSIRLLAAFNHLHIFIDPNPDPAVSHAERRRLFEKVAGWNEYNTELLSKGGGIFDRSAKHIPISKEAKKALGLSRSSYSGEELIQAILRAPVDLLWNGGIGTYVKASSESHFDASDAVNDRVRIDASELRCRVVGEGGNLGFTQAARIEAARKGVRLNTDAIDNSAGVDMSDHEVNLKILLGGLLRQGKIKDFKARNAWIRKIEEDEICLVLSHNISNNLALSLDERRRKSQRLFFRKLISELAEGGVLQREQDHIPFDVDLQDAGDIAAQLPRPVLASLMGFQKLHLSAQLEKEGAFLDKKFDSFILSYFPSALQKKFPEAVLAHPLRNEIVSTEILNFIVNRSGIAFFTRAQMRTGASYTQIAETWLQARELLGIEDFLSESERLKMPPALFLDFLVLLEEGFFDICCRILEGHLLPHKRSAKQAFAGILVRVSKHGHHSLSREDRSLLRKLPKSMQGQVQEAFTKAESLSVAFLLLEREAELRGLGDPVEVYFQSIRRHRLDVLLKLLSGFEAGTAYELRFLSRIQQMLQELIFVLIEHPVESSTLHIERLVDYSEMLARSGSMNMAVLYEMLSECLGSVFIEGR